MPARFLLALDQGTTSSRAMLFDAEGRSAGASQRELPQVFPQDGWVEHDAERIWQDTLAVGRAVLAEQRVEAAQVAALGITNQRETTVLWERATGRALHHAIVWQDRRTAAACERLAAAGHDDLVQQRTGLRLDPYFSATKIAWLLDHVPGARARAQRGELCCGTIDSWLLFRLTGDARHATDATNAARTLLFDIHRQCWDEQLLQLFGVPAALLPEVLDCAADFGACLPEHFGRPIPIAGIAGDQQAAAIGQACWEPGQLKSTYGTGCFALLNTGARAPRSGQRLLTTVGYRLAGRTSYALEGSIYSAGSIVQWLRDGLRLFQSAEQSEALARAADPRRRVHLVPAFTGLGAPHWDSHARGAILGLTRDVTAADIVAAGLQSVGHQTADLLEAMAADGAPAPPSLRVDGGLSRNGYAMQFLADILDVAVERPAVTETTALGAALLAGLQVGLCESPAALSRLWRAETRFEPAMPAAERRERRAAWAGAVARVLTHA